MRIKVKPTQVEWPGALGTADVETIGTAFSLFKPVAPRVRNADLIELKAVVVRSAALLAVDIAVIWAHHRANQAA